MDCMNPKFLKCLAFIALGLGVMSVAQAKLPPGYAVTQTGNLVFVKTPWGSSVYIGPVGMDSINHYAFEIPLSDFRAQVSASQGGSYTATGMPQGPSNTGPASMGDEGALIQEANRLYNKGDFRRALEYVDELSRRNPKNVRAWVMKGSLMHVMGQKDLARQSWQKALDIDPTNTQIENILKEMQ